LTKPFLIGCCACGSLMLKSGGRGPSIFIDGVMDRSKLSALAGDVQLADFDSSAEAEIAAAKAGWKVENQNHRCPNCTFEQGRRGMVIDRSTMQAVF
jgi:hypothetical protein